MPAIYPLPTSPNPPNLPNGRVTARNKPLQLRDLGDVGTLGGHRPQFAGYRRGAQMEIFQ